MPIVQFQVINKMTLFSQRKGISPLTKAIQRESLDEDLRTAFWNALCLRLWDRWSPSDAYGLQPQDGAFVEVLVSNIWMHLFKRPKDDQPPFHPDLRRSAYRELRLVVLSAEWWECLDLIEFIVKNVPADFDPKLTKIINSVLESENSAYRVIGDEIAEISDEHEIEPIQTALESGPASCRQHFARALELLSDRKQPDYRNSIKESVSAVESACRVIADQPKATLGDCLKVINSRRPLHPAFKDALSKLYGYTSDSDGIRHSLTDNGSNLTFADAKFMLATCSAFVNYLWTCAAEDGLSVDIS